MDMICMNCDARLVRPSRMSSLQCSNCYSNRVVTFQFYEDLKRSGLLAMLNASSYGKFAENSWQGSIKPTCKHSNAGPSPLNPETVVCWDCTAVLKS